MSILTLIGVGGASVNTDIVNTKFQSGIDQIVSTAIEVQGAAGDLLVALATLKLISFLYMSFFKPDGEEFLEGLAKNIAMIMVITMLTYNWGAFANYMRGYIVGGSAPGGQTAQSMGVDPATVANKGVDRVAVIFNAEAREKIVNSTVVIGTGQYSNLQDQRRQKAREQNKESYDSWASSLTGVEPSALIAQVSDSIEGLVLEVAVVATFILLALLTVFVHFYVALNIFALTMDWYITVLITQLFIPFALNKHTSSIASSALNAVVGKSVQLAVLLLVLGMFDSMTQGAIDSTPTLYELLAALLDALLLAFMVQRAPNIADSIYRAGGNPIDIGAVAASAASSMASSVASGLKPTKPDDDDPDPHTDGGSRPDAGSGLEAGGESVSMEASSIGVGAPSEPSTNAPSVASELLMGAGKDGNVTSGTQDQTLGASAAHADARGASDGLTERVQEQREGQKSVADVLAEQEAANTPRYISGGESMQAIGQGMDKYAAVGPQDWANVQQQDARQAQAAEHALDAQDSYDVTRQSHAIDANEDVSQSPYDVTRQQHAVSEAPSPSTSDDQKNGEDS